MLAEGFRGRMAHRVGTKGTPIVLALDLMRTPGETTEALKQRAIRVVQQTGEAVCAVKVNAPLLLVIGLDGVKDVVSAAHEQGVQAIMDAKINDVGHMNTFMAHTYFAAGFDAVIANPLVGWEEGLQPVFEAATKAKAGVILLAYLSHKSAAEGYGLHVTDTSPARPLYRIFLERAIRWKADGVVVGATHPDKIREAAETLRGTVPIYTPGVGAQGGSLQEAMSSGATYPIIGRTIVEAENPRQIALNMKEEILKLRGSLQAS